MFSIHLERVQAAADRLPEQIVVLRNMLDELEQVKQSLSKMSFTQVSVLKLERSRGELEEELRVLQQMRSCLNEAVRIYRRTEQQITEIYDMDSIKYPRTSFGVSRITGLDGFEELIPFRR